MTTPASIVPGAPTPPDPLETALRRFGPALHRPQLGDGDVSYTLHDSAVGRLLLAVRADGAVVVCRYVADQETVPALLQRVSDAVSARVLASNRPVDGLRSQLDEYLAGRRRTFDLVVEPVLATPFARTVLTALPAAAGYGERTSYGRLATAAGRPGAARAIGGALNANPLCLLLPCHRVVGSNGALTGYAGGLAAKEHLLELEQGR